MNNLDFKIIQRLLKIPKAPKQAILRYQQKPFEELQELYINAINDQVSEHELIRLFGKHPYEFANDCSAPIPVYNNCFAPLFVDDEQRLYFIYNPEQAQYVVRLSRSKTTICAQNSQRYEYPNIGDEIRLYTANKETFFTSTVLSIIEYEGRRATALITLSL